MRSENGTTGESFMRIPILLLVLLPSLKPAIAYDPEISPTLEPPKTKMEEFLGTCSNQYENINALGLEVFGSILVKFIAELEQKLATDSTNPYYWYLKGCSSFASLYMHKNSSPEQKALRKQLIAEYSKALEYNAKKMSLTEAHLSLITANQPLIEESTKQYLILRKKNGRYNKREHRLLLLEKIIPSQIKQNKFQEAMETLDFVDKTFPDKALGDTGNDAWRKYFEDEVKKQKESIENSG